MTAISTGAAIALAVGGGASAGSTIYAAKKQSSAAKRAGEQQTAANREALEFEREQDRLDRQQFAESEAYNRRQYEEAIAEDQRRYEIESMLGAERYGDAKARADALDAFDREKYQTRQTQVAPYRTVGVSNLNRLEGVASMADLARGYR